MSVGLCTCLQITQVSELPFLNGPESCAYAAT